MIGQHRPYETKKDPRTVAGPSCQWLLDEFTLTLVSDSKVARTIAGLAEVEKFYVDLLYALAERP